MKRQTSLPEFAKLLAYRRLNMWPREREEVQRAIIAAQTCELLRASDKGKTFEWENFVPKLERKQRKKCMSPEDVFAFFAGMPGVIIKDA